MRHLIYLAVLAGCLGCAVVLEPLFKLGVLCSWRRLLLTLGPVVAVFGGWDLLAIAAGQWRYDPGQILGVTLPGRLPLEELLFFIVVPLCAILGFEAVRAVRHYPVGDEEPGTGTGTAGPVGTARCAADPAAGGWAAGRTDDPSGGR